MDLKKLSILHILMAIVFFLSGLITNILQGLLYVFLYNINRPLYRKLNYYLIYTSWSQVVALAEWWSGSTCTMFADDETMKKFGKEHSIIVMNHKYDVDWLMCWLVCDKLKMLGNAKTCAKTSLKYLPVIGWGWVFAEMVFLDRSWEKDSLSLGAKLDRLFSYEDPIMILFFCEGTRFTPEKHKASMEFASAHNYPILKYHLLPRTRGFNFSVSHLKDKANAIYDVQLAFPNDTKPTFGGILRGEKFDGHMYIRRIPISEVPIDSDESTTAWLHDLYKQKDDVMKRYLETNCFPGEPYKIKRRIQPLLNVIFWFCAVGIPFAYYFVHLLFCGTYWVQALAITFLVILFTAVHMMIGVTNSNKGSSYGKSENTSPKRDGLKMELGMNGDANDKISELHRRNNNHSDFDKKNDVAS